MFLLSIVELFKFNTNGNHLILADMKLFKSVKSLTSFAYIKITPALIIYTLIVLAFAVAVFWFNPSVKGNFKKRSWKAAALIVPIAVVVATPAIGMPVYRAFGISTDESVNNFVENEKFIHNSFLAFFVQTSTENFFKGVKEPDDYSIDTMQDLVEPDPVDTTGFKTKPNVLVIMSESYADFRKFESDEFALPVQDAYDGFDTVASRGFKGKTIVPTFASFTVRTEFELNFGLPVRSIGDPNMPQRDLDETDQTTIPRYYKEILGYKTAYVHPFISTFYSRERLYPYFGFDELIFDEDFDVPVERAISTYISDETIYNELKYLVENTEEPIFIHTTTMQNHQPYDKGEDPSAELTNYLDEIKLSSNELLEFTEDLKEIDEPTVVLFVGDHFPSLRGDNSVYTQLGIDSTNCQEVYEQDYIVWANYDFDYSALTTDEVSTFYLPYTVLNAIHAPTNDYIDSMLKKMETLPIYSTCYDDSVGTDDFLDYITYDRIFGENYTSWESLSGNTTIGQKQIA
jgi:phosphoglycerol transferase MdoB-like AlkP superfamily enzyme